MYIYVLMCYKHMVIASLFSFHMMLSVKTLYTKVWMNHIENHFLVFLWAKPVHSIWYIYFVYHIVYVCILLFYAFTIQSKGEKLWRGLVNIHTRLLSWTSRGYVCMYYSHHCLGPLQHVSTCSHTLYSFV